MKVIKVLRRSVVGLAVVLLCACQSQPPIPSPVDDAGSEAVTPAPAPVERPAAETPAEPPALERPQRAPDQNASVIMALEAQGRQYILEQQWQRAIAAAEHGLRINRRYAPFYQILAEGYRALENYPQAAQFARQGLRFCGNRCAEIEALLNTLGSQ